MPHLRANDVVVPTRPCFPIFPSLRQLRRNSRQRAAFRSATKRATVRHKIVVPLLTPSGLSAQSVGRVA
jgi:hypothetical protein